MSDRPRTVGDYLKMAGLTNQPAETPEQPKQAAKTETPKPAPAQPKTAEKEEGDAGYRREAKGEAKQEARGEASDGHNPREDHMSAEAQDTGKSAQVEEGQVLYDARLIKTAAQKALLERNILIPDEKVAEATWASIQAAEQAQAKQAAAQKQAELEHQGAMMYTGMMKQSAAVQLASGEIDLAGAYKAAALAGCDVNEILTKAAQIKKAMADGAYAAMPHDTFFAGQQGLAARNVSETQSAAGAGTATQEYHAEGEAGTRGPVEGPDEKTERMVDHVTLPGNPGVNHGQRVDQGKGLGA